MLELFIRVGLISYYCVQSMASRDILMDEAHCSEGKRWTIIFLKLKHFLDLDV
jgi:hypothetical protein